MAKQFTVTPNYLRGIDLAYDLASQSDLFREDSYKAIASKGHVEAQDYLDSILLTKDKTADTFDVKKYNMFTNPEDQIGYLRNEYFLKTIDPAKYEEASKYYEAKYQEAINEQYYNSMNWFEKTMNTVGGFFGRIFQGAYSTLEGVADALIAAGGIIAEGGARVFGQTDTAEAIKKGTEEAINIDLTGLEEIKKSVDEMITASPLSRSWIGRQLDSAAESIGKMAPLIVSSIASGGTTIPASAKFFLGQGKASAAYYGAMAGESYRDLINVAPENETWRRLLSTVTSVGLEAGTEKLSDFIFPTIHNLWGNLGLQIFSEGFEEVEAELGGALMNLMLFNRTTVDPQGEFSLRTVLEAMFVGSLVGGIMGGGQAIISPRAVKTSDGKIMLKRDADEAGITDYTKYSKTQSFNILSRMQQLSDQFNKISKTQSVLDKYGMVSVQQAQSDSRPQVRDAINDALSEDLERDKRIIKNSLALSKFAELIGEKEFNDAMTLLNNATEISSETINKYTNFQYSDNKYVRSVQDRLEKLNPDNKFEIDNDLRGDYAKLADILNKTYGVQLVVGKVFNKDGNANSDIMTTGDIKSPDGIVFMDRETLRNISIEAALSQIINKQLATAFKNDSANAFSMNNKEYKKLVDVVLGEEQTNYTETEIKNILADSLLFDDKAITRAFFGSKATVRRMFNWLHKSIKQTQMAVKNEATKIKYNTLLKIKQRWIKNIGKVIGNVIDMQNAVRRYSLDPQDEELLKQSMTDINELNRHLIMTDIDFSPFAINKYATTRYLLDRTITDKKAADLNFDLIYDPNYYEADFVAEINNAYPNAKSFGEAMFDYVHDRFDMFISKENKALVRAISLTEFLKKDKLDKTIRELKESKRFQLSDFFDEKLFSNFSRNVYPDTSVYIEYANQPVSQDGVVAWYDTDYKSITLNVYTDTNLDTLIPVLAEKLLHETTHYIADTQGLSAGGNPDTYSRAASWLYSNRNDVFNDLADVLLGDQMTDNNYENMSVSDKIREMGKMMYTLDVGEMYARGMSYEYSKFDGFSMREKGDYMVVEAHGIYSDIWNTRVNIPLDRLPDYRSMSKEVKQTGKKQYMKRNFMEEFNEKYGEDYESIGFSKKAADELAQSVTNADVIENLFTVQDYGSPEALKTLENMLFADNENIKSFRDILEVYLGFYQDKPKNPDLLERKKGVYYYIAAQDLKPDKTSYSKLTAALTDSSKSLLSEVETSYSLDKLVGEESDTRMSDLTQSESEEEQEREVSKDELTTKDIDALKDKLNDKTISGKERAATYQVMAETKDSLKSKTLQEKMAPLLWDNVADRLRRQRNRLLTIPEENRSEAQLSLLEKADKMLSEENEVIYGKTVPQQLVLDLISDIKTNANSSDIDKKVTLGKKSAERATKVKKEQKTKAAEKKVEDVKRHRISKALIAPFTNTQLTADNYKILKDKVDIPFRKKAREVADILGLEISKNNSTIGGYDLTEKGETIKLNELSYAFYFYNEDNLDNVDLFAAIMGEIGYERQYATISAIYVKDPNEADGTEYRILVKDDADPIAIVKALQDANISEYTVDPDDNQITLMAFNFDKEKADDLIAKIPNLIKILNDGGVYDRSTQTYFKSNYLDSEARGRIIKDRIASLSERGQKGQLSLFEDAQLSYLEAVYNEYLKAEGKLPETEVKEEVKEEKPAKVEKPAKKEKIKTEKPATAEQAVLEKVNETPGLENITEENMTYEASDGTKVDTLAAKAEVDYSKEPMDKATELKAIDLIRYIEERPKEKSESRVKGVDVVEYTTLSQEKFEKKNVLLLDSLTDKEAAQLYEYFRTEANKANFTKDGGDITVISPLNTLSANFIMYLYKNREDPRFKSIKNKIAVWYTTALSSGAQPMGAQSYYFFPHNAVSEAAKEAKVSIDNATLNKILSSIKLFESNSKESLGETATKKLEELTKQIKNEKDPFNRKELNYQKSQWIGLANLLEEGDNAKIIDAFVSILMSQDTDQIDNMQTVEAINETVLEYLVKTAAETSGLDVSVKDVESSPTIGQETAKKLRKFFDNMVSIQYLAMLSSPRTALKNAYSNTMVLATAVVEDATASLFYNKGFLSEGTQVGYVGQYDEDFKKFVNEKFGPYIRSKNEGSKYFTNKGTELKEQFAESQSITSKNKALKKISDIESKMLSDKFWTNKRSMRNLCNSLVGSKSLILLESEQALKNMYYDKSMTSQQRNLLTREQLYSKINKTNEKLAELYKDATSGSETSNKSAVELGIELGIDLLNIEGDPNTSLINNSLYRANKILFKTDNVMTKLLETAKKKNWTGVTMMVKLLYPFARMTVNGATYILDRSPVGVMKGILRASQTKLMYYNDMLREINNYYKGQYRLELDKSGAKFTEEGYKAWFENNAPEALRKAIGTSDKAGIKTAYQALFDSGAIAPGLIGTHKAGDVFRRAEAIESLSQGITGTAIMALGLILAAITGAFDYDDDDDYLGPIMRFGDMKIALEDLAPYSTVFTLGAMLGSGKRISDPIKAVVDTFINQSFLGVLDSAITYSNSVGDYFKNTAINYLTRFQPAIIKNASKIIYNQKKSKSGDFFTKLWYTLASNTLTLAWTVPNKINPYTGEAEKYYETSSILGGLSRLLPAQIYIDNKSDLEKQAMKYGVESSGLSGTFKINGVDIVLTPKQKEKYATQRALYLQQLYSKLMNGEKVTVEDESGKRITTTYEDATDEQKAKLIKRIYDQATAATKVKYWTDKGNTYVCTTPDEYNKYKDLVNTANIVRRNNWSGSKFVQA